VGVSIDVVGIGRCSKTQSKQNPIESFAENEDKKGVFGIKSTRKNSR